MVIAGREYTVPSTRRRCLAQMVDLIIVSIAWCSVLLWIMDLNGMTNFNMFFINFFKTDDKEFHLKVIAAALNVDVIMIVYEVLWIWGNNGATPGKFLFGLRMVMCDTSTTVQPNRVLVVPGSRVSLSACIVRAVAKVIITFKLPVFHSGAVFQHNRCIHDVAAGTIVVQDGERWALM